MATTYLRLAPETSILIVDNGKTVGGVWSKERIYPNLYTQIGHGLFEYSSYPMKAEGLSPDRYISGETVHGYLNDYSRDHDLTRRIRLNVQIEKVEPLSDAPNSGWELHVAGKDATLRCDKLIVATGVSSAPYVPPIPKAKFQAPIIHSSQIGESIDKLTAPDVKRVVILGAAKSAYDTTYMLLLKGKRVEWVIRNNGAGPLAIMPPRLFGYLNTVDIMATRFLASFSPAILNTKGIWYRVLQRSKFGLQFTKFFWRNLTRVAEAHAGYSSNSNMGKLRPIPEGYG